jgi:hypothetical protein
MRYRDIEYTVVQGIERGVWKWTASVAGVVVMGQAAVKFQAVAAAEKAIDRALAQNKLRVIPPRRQPDYLSVLSAIIVVLRMQDQATA